MALNNENNNDCCKCTTPEYELILNEQGPQGRQGEKGDAGFTPIISVKDNTPSNYTLNILTQDGQITTPNLKANLPAGGATGQVLTKNSGEQDDCSWQNLPASTIETEGIARLATEADFETTEDTEASDNTIVTPALFNSEFEKQSANFVTKNTQQTITSKKTFMSDVTIRDDLILQNNIVNYNTVDGIKPNIIKHIPTSNNIIIGETQAFTSEYYKNLGIEIQSNNVDNDAGIYTHRDGNRYPLLDSSNVTAGNNITIDKTSTGITINTTGGGEVPKDVALKSADQTFTGHNYFNGQVNFNGTVQFTNQQVNIPKLYSSNKITGANISLDSAGQSYKFPCEKGTMSLSATSGDEAGTSAGLYITGAGIDNKRLLTEGDAYTLPPATADTLGGIKVGENLTITEDGVLNATGTVPTNMVTTDTDQTITGLKTHKTGGPPYAGNIYITDNNSFGKGSRLLITNTSVNIAKNANRNGYYSASYGTECLFLNDNRENSSNDYFGISTSRRGGTYWTIGWGNAPATIFADSLKRQKNFQSPSYDVLDTSNIGNYVNTYANLSVNTLLKIDTTELSTAITTGTTQNLLDLISLTGSASNVVTTANIDASNYNLTGGILKLPYMPTVNNKYTNAYCDYNIDVRITGTIDGSVNTAREFNIELQRASDNSIVETHNITKTNTNDLTGKGVVFSTYTNTSSDPFIANGLKLVLNNTSGQTVTITGVTLLVKGRTY